MASSSCMFFINLIHLLCFFTAWGVTIWVFIFGIIMFGVLPKHTVGRMRIKILPAYFFIMVTCSSGLLVTSSFWWSESPTSSKYEFGYLVAAFLLNTTNSYVFLPIVVQAVKRRHEEERRLSMGKQIGWSERRSLPKPSPQLTDANRKFHTIHVTSALAFTLSVGCFAFYSSYLAAKINL